MHLAQLRRILREHQPQDEKERGDVALIIQLVEVHPDLLERTCRPGHVTGSALVVDPKLGQVLLHFHKSLGRWLQFGGHADGEEDPAEVALREAREESGLEVLEFFPNTLHPKPADIDVHRIPATPGEGAHLHLDFRYVLASGKDLALRPSHGESRQFAWHSYEEVATMVDEIDPALQRLVAKAAALCRRRQAS